MCLSVHLDAELEGLDTDLVPAREEQPVPGPADFPELSASNPKRAALPRSSSPAALSRSSSPAAQTPKLVAKSTSAGPIAFIPVTPGQNMYLEIQHKLEEVCEGHIVLVTVANYLIRSLISAQLAQELKFD